MKIRTGFVSNSSSSSFVLVVTMEAYDRFLSAATDFEKAVMKELESKKGKLGQLDVITFALYTDSGGGGTLEYVRQDFDFDKYGIDPEKDEDCIYSAWEKFESSLQEGESVGGSTNF